MRIWLVVGEKRGDNAQVRRLASLVGQPVEEKFVAMKPEWVDGKPPVAASIEHVAAAESDTLTGPWPDLVLTAGRRLASVALWIREVSGGRTRIVVVGKPRGRLADFDLVVVAEHYVLSPAPNVARHAYPLMSIDPEGLEAARAVWSERLAARRRPIVAVLVGGATGGLRFGRDEAARLLADARRFAEADGGSIFVVTSRRTPAAVVAFLESAIRSDDGERLSIYDAATSGVENPYQGLLACADHFVVTTDSLSMMVEAAQRGRPLSLFALGREPTGPERFFEGLGLLSAIDPTRDALPAGGVMARTLAALGLPIHSRDLTAIARRLVADGRAGWSSEAPPAPRPWTDEGCDEIVARIRSFADGSD